MEISDTIDPVNDPELPSAAEQVIYAALNRQAIFNDEQQPNSRNLLTNIRWVLIFVIVFALSKKHHFKSQFL